MPPKICLIGAGSAVFSLSMIRDFCLTPRLQGSTITFMDNDPDRLEGAYGLCCRYAAETGIQLNLEKTTHRREALLGADFVINTALAAGHQRLQEGWEVGRRNGYRIGGSLHLMHDEAFWVNYHQYRLFESVLEDILEICPQAWYLQVANPVFAGITYLARKYPQVKMVGLCHGYRGVYRVASVLGLNPDEITFEIPGVNHFVWLTHLYQNGEDALPRLKEWTEQEAEQYFSTCQLSDDVGPKAVDLYRRYGVFPIGDTCTPGGGSWPFWYHTDEETERFWKEDPWEWYQGYFRGGREMIETIRKAVQDPSVRVTELFPPKKSGEVMVEMIESLACDIPRVLIGNIPNRGELVPGLPQNVAVEVPCLVSKRGIEGVRTQPLPGPIVTRIFRDRIAPMEAELAAYQQGSRDLLLELVMMDPFTHSLDQARTVLDEILALPYHTEMRQHYRS